MKKLELEIFAGIDTCLGGACPTVYRAEGGRFFVQGSVVPDIVKSAVNTPPGESLVEIPEALLRNAAARLLAQSK